MGEILIIFKAKCGKAHPNDVNIGDVKRRFYLLVVSLKVESSCKMRLPVCTHSSLMYKLDRCNHHSSSRLYEVIATQVLGKASSRLSIDNAAAQYTLKHGDLLLHVLEIQYIVVVGCVDIQNVVRHGTTGVIYLLDNVQARFGEGIGNTGQQTGMVFIDNGKSYRLALPLRQGRFGEVDRVLDGTVLKEVLDGVGSHGSGGVFGLLGGGAEVGENDGVLVVPAQIIGEVGDVSAISTVKEGLHGLGIHELASGKVEEDGVALAVVNNITIDDAVCTTLTLDVGNVETDVVGISAGGLDAVDKSDFTGELQSTLDGETGVICYGAERKARNAAIMSVKKLRTLLGQKSNAYRHRIQCNIGNV